MRKQIDRGPADDEDPVRVTEGKGGAAGAAAGMGLGTAFGPEFVSCPCEDATR